MASSHRKAVRKAAKPLEQKKPMGRPPKSVNLVVRNPVRSKNGSKEADCSGSNSSDSGVEDEDGPVEEDELYGKVVSEDDGLSGDAVVSKPRRKTKGKQVDGDPRGA
jgi:hypothetical protein